MADSDRLRPFLTGVALHWVCTMTGRIDADIRADKTVIANCNTGFVEDSEIEVSKEPLSNAYLLAVVAAERLIQQKVIVAHMVKQLFDDFLHSLSLRRS